MLAVILLILFQTLKAYLYVHDILLTFNLTCLFFSCFKQLLQMVATSMNCLGHHGMFFLAAAVSDFYVPWESMVGSICRKCIHVFIIFKKTNYGCPGRGETCGIMHIGLQRKTKTHPYEYTC